MATTQQSTSLEELTAEVSSSALTPLRFLERSAAVWKHRPAVVSGKHTWTYDEHYDRVRRAASVARDELGIKPGDRLAVLLPNVAPMLELHYAVPGIGGVLVPLNTRLASPEYAYILAHSGATALVAYRPLQAALDPALEELGRAAPRVVWVEEDPEDSEYEQLLAAADPIDLERPDHERTLISINYTSGTTGRPKGVMTTHRGAYLHALGVDRRGPPDAAQQLPVDAADVPLQRLGLHVGGVRDGGQARLPPEGRGQADLARADPRGRHAPVRGAHRAHHDHRSRGSRGARRARPGLRRRRPAVAGAARGRGEAEAADHAPVRADGDLRAAGRVRLEPRLGRSRR